jgi:hypothetical protein
MMPAPLLPFVLGAGAITSIARTVLFSLGIGIVTFSGLQVVIGNIASLLTGAIGGVAGEGAEWVICSLKLTAVASIFVSAYTVKAAMIPARRFGLI